MRILFLLLAALLASGRAARADDAHLLRQVQTIPLDGVEGRFDHMAYDAGHDRLFLAALGNDTLEVIDLKAGTRLRQIPGLKKPTGIAVVPDADRVAVASGNDGQLRLFDPSLDLVGTIVSLEDADNVRTDEAAKRVYVGYGDGALAIVDPLRAEKLASIPLSGHPESFQLETQGSRIFVNVPTARHVAVIDRTKSAVVATWPIAEAQANFPMALDDAEHRLFVGCREPARLLALDTESGRVVASLPSCGDTDDLFYDAARKRVYLSGGEGCIDVFAQTDADHYEKVETLSTAPGARTSLFVPAIRRLFLAVPHRGGQRAELRVFEAP